MNPLFRPAHYLARMVRKGDIGSLELLDLYLDRINQLNGLTRALCVIDAERARKRARAADRARSQGESWGPLHGLPITVKESFDVAGLPTTWGVSEYRNNIATGNAAAVDRLLAAGAIVMGKTNVPVLLADWQSFNPLYGTTCNPWNHDRVPGGSSGGAAAALATGFTSLELGSDIGGSIRNPAHYCGIYGHKPTYGICSDEGHRLPRWITGNDIAVIGPLARSARDLELALRLITGPDSRDGLAWRISLPRQSRKPWRDWRVAVLPDAETAPVDSAIRNRVLEVADFARRQGATVSVAARPDIDLAEAHEVFIHLLRAATSRSLSDDGFARNEELARTTPASATDYESWMLRGSTLSHRDWLACNEQRHRMRERWAEFFRDWDVMLCPAAATTAFPHDQKGERWERMITVDGKSQPSTTQMFWAGYSGMAYLPSTVAPVGLAADGLPVGVQIIGPLYGDLTCIEFARMLERDLGGFSSPPDGR